MNPRKHGINIGLKCMSDFRELCFIKTMRNVIYCLLKVSVLTDIKTKFFRLKIVLITTQLSNGSPEIYIFNHQIQNADNMD